MLIADWSKPFVENWFLTLVLIFAGASLIGTLAKQARKYACHQQELALKRDLVERGLTVEEIERIIAANSHSAGRDSSA